MTESDNVLGAYFGIVRRSPEEKVLQLVIELGAQVVGAEEGSLLVFDEARNDLVFAMTVGSEASAKALIGQRVPLGQGLTGLAALTHEVQIGAPTFKDVRQAEDRGAAGGGPTAVLAAPMLIVDHLIGVITAVSFRPEKRFGAADAQLYARLASVAGVVVDQSRRLAAVEALRTRADSPRPLTEQERFEKEILDRVTRLAHAAPGRLEKVARILSLIEDLSPSS